ncbi:MAG: metal-sulfur cluster assembly factor [Bacteroidetes bacterium]|nr:metal-sulfur cluster assembly factor [Bacteroidota bacterium]MBS1629465.1 metal-sulfur cluster assembly factor [Bacteroidota bacterium]
MSNIITNDSIRCAVATTGLYNVYDPEIGLNVVDLGLIYQIDFDEAAKQIHATMTLTTQFCPMGDSIVSNVIQSLGESFSDFEPHVYLTFEPPWSHNRISEAGQEFLSR